MVGNGEQWWAMVDGVGNGGQLWAIVRNGQNGGQWLAVVGNGPPAEKSVLKKYFAVCK